MLLLKKIKVKNEYDKKVNNNENKKRFLLSFPFLLISIIEIKTNCRKIKKDKVFNIKYMFIK